MDLAQAAQDRPCCDLADSDHRLRDFGLLVKRGVGFDELAYPRFDGVELLLQRFADPLDGVVYGLWAVLQAVFLLGQGCAEVVPPVEQVRYFLARGTRRAVGAYFLLLGEAQYHPRVYGVGLGFHAFAFGEAPDARRVEPGEGQGFACERLDEVSLVPSGGLEDRERVFEGPDMLEEFGEALLVVGYAEASLFAEHFERFFGYVYGYDL